LKQDELKSLSRIIHGIHPHPCPLPEGEGFGRLSLWERPREARVRVYRIQWGAFEDLDEAIQKQEEFRELGVGPVYVVGKDGSFRYKVMVGDYSTYKDAKAACVRFKKQGKNAGSGFVTQVEVEKAQADQEDIPYVESIVSPALSRIARSLSSTGQVERDTAAFRILIGSYSELPPAARLRASLWCRGEKEPVYILQRENSYQVLVGDFSNHDEADHALARLSALPFDEVAAIVEPTAGEEFVDITVLRDEGQLLAAVVAKHPARNQNQWCNIDAALQFLHYYPGSSHLDRVRLTFGIRLYEVFWLQRDETGRTGENQRLLLSAAEQYEAICAMDPESPLRVEATYRLGLAQHRLTGFGLANNQLRSAIATIASVSSEIFNDPIKAMNYLAFRFEQAKGSRGNGTLEDYWVPVPG